MPSTRWDSTSPRGPCSEAVASLEAAIGIAREVGECRRHRPGYVNLGEAKFYCGDVRGAAEVVREGIVATDEVGISRTYGHFIRENGIAYAYDLGDWDEADALADGESSPSSRPVGRRVAMA